MQPTNKPSNAAAMIPFVSRIRAFDEAAMSPIMSTDVTAMFPETKPPSSKSIMSPTLTAAHHSFVLCVRLMS